MRRFPLRSLCPALALSAALLTASAAGAELPRLTVSDQAAASQTVTVTGLPEDCQSLQITLSLSGEADCVYTPDIALEEPYIYTAARQNGPQVTLYLTAKSGALTRNGTLILGTLSTAEIPFIVTGASHMKLLDSDQEEQSYSSLSGTGGQTGDASENGYPEEPDSAGADTPGEPEEEQPAKVVFHDVPGHAWFAQAVDFVCRKGLMTGTGEGLFSPELTTSRAMIVTILYRLESSPTVSGGAFTDVPEGAWYAAAVNWASANGIISGYGTGCFGPDDPITREQLAAVLYRYAAYKGYDVNGRAALDGYTDSGSVAPYAADPMAWAVECGLLNGTGSARLDPGGSATRAQAATILMRFCQWSAE